MEHWAKTIAKNGGVAAVTIQEGADRLRELETEVERLKKDQIECGNWIGNKMLQPEWDSFKKSLEVINHWKTRAEKAEAEVANAVDGVIDGGSIPDALLVVHVPRSPVGYCVGQPVKVILPAIDAATKEGSK